MTTKTSQPGTEESNNLGRRAFLRRSAAATTAAIGVGAGAHHMGHSPISPAAAAWDSGNSRQWYVAATWIGETVNGLFSDSEDLSGYTGSDALATAIEEKSLQLQATNEQILSGLENTVEYADNAAIPTGMEAVVTSFNDGSDQTVTQTKMEEAIDEYYTAVQTDILTAWQNAYAQLTNFYDQLNAFSPGDGDTDIIPADMLGIKKSSGFTNGDVIQLPYNYDDSIAGDTTGNYDITLADGSTFTVTYVERDGDFSSYPHAAVNSLYPLQFWSNHAADRGSDTDNNGIKTLDTARYRSIYSGITDSKDRVYSNLSGFVSDLYAQYSPGEIDAADIVDPLTAHTEFSNEVDDDSFRGAHAAGQLGIPRATGSEPLLIHLETDDIEIEGSIYGDLSNETDFTGFDTGVTYDPVNFDAPMWVRGTYISEDADGNITETTDYFDLEQPFSILEATDQDGNDVTNVNFDEGTSYDPADIATIQEQLEEVRKQQQEYLAEQDEAAGGGGTLFSLGGFNFGPGETVIAGLAAVVLGGYLTN